MVFTYSNNFGAPNLVGVLYGQTEFQHFKFPFSFSDLSKKDKRTEEYCRMHVHGLRIDGMDRRNVKSTLYVAELDKIMTCLYEDHKTVERDLVIYKGGHVESALLKRLQIPCFNIQVVGCPKYDSLTDVFEPAQNCAMAKTQFTLCHARVPRLSAMVIKPVTNNSFRLFL